jgi:hypothetical protein
LEENFSTSSEQHFFNFNTTRQSRNPKNAQQKMPERRKCVKGPKVLSYRHEDFEITNTPFFRT